MLLRVIFVVFFQTVINKTLVYDTDGDGLIENSGFADQTFDAWPVTGPRYLSSITVFGINKMWSRFIQNFSATEHAQQNLSLTLYSFQ